MSQGNGPWIRQSACIKELPFCIAPIYCPDGFFVYPKICCALSTRWVLSFSGCRLKRLEVTEICLRSSKGKQQEFTESLSGIRQGLRNLEENENVSGDYKLVPTEDAVVVFELPAEGWWWWWWCRGSKRWCEACWQPEPSIRNLTGRMSAT